MSGKIKILFVGAVALCCLAAPAGAAAKGPVVYEQARALPTKSGANVKIVVFTNRATRTRVKVDGITDGFKAAKLFDRGCGRLRCEKWRLYVPRTGEQECYDITARALRGKLRITEPLTVCEPFRGGAV